jgi:hypothetical protein
VLGVLVLGERVRWNEPVGGVVILVGIALASGVLGRRRRTAVVEETAARPVTVPHEARDGVRGA